MLSCRWREWERRIIRTSGGQFFPFTLFVDLQREYFAQLWKFWNSVFLQNFADGAHSDVALARGDKRFKDEAWQEMPYYDLLKQSYLLGSRQLHEFVDQAQVDDKTKLQLRFYARQFIDAMSPSNFPATNPEVIRKAIETRSVSLTDGIQNFIDDLQKGRITRVDESAFEVGRNLAITPGSVVLERTDPVDPVRSANPGGREDTTADRPALHQQILSVGPWRRQFTR